MTYKKYTSTELAHFVGRQRGCDDERFQLLAKILRCGKLRAAGIQGVGEDHAMLLSITGNGNLSDETAIQGRVVCFCDIPIDDSLGLHMSKYSSFGLAFSKSFLVDKGANPVFYVVRDALIPPITLVPTGSGSFEPKQGITRAELLDIIHKEAGALSTQNYGLMFGSKDQDLQKLLFRNTQFQQLLYQAVLAFVKPFDSAAPEESPENYYIEREWRVYGDVLFQLSDVSWIFLPPSYKDSFGKEFPDFSGAIYP